VALFTLSQGVLHLGQARVPCVFVSRMYLARHERWQICWHGRRVALSACELMTFKHTGQSGKQTLHIGGLPCCLALRRHWACTWWPQDRRGILSCPVGLLHRAHGPSSKGVLLLKKGAPESRLLALGVASDMLLSLALRGSMVVWGLVSGVTPAGIGSAPSRGALGDGVLP
jgi:hypothetical protein